MCHAIVIMAGNGRIQDIVERQYVGRFAICGGYERYRLFYCLQSTDDKYYHTYIYFRIYQLHLGGSYAE